MTDLHTNEQVPTLEVLRHSERCTGHFGAARWAGFQRDVAWFRDRMSPSSWLRSQRDHGYNATPVWGLLGHALADLAPASDGSILALTLIDPDWLFCAVAGLCALRKDRSFAAARLGPCVPHRRRAAGDVRRLDAPARAPAFARLHRRRLCRAQLVDAARARPLGSRYRPSERSTETRRSITRRRDRRVGSQAAALQIYIMRAHCVIE
jgi:hypothetical protein